MKHTRFTLTFLAATLLPLATFAQLKVTIQSKDTDLTHTRQLEATVTGGSGQYTYAWGTTTEHQVIPENNSANRITVSGAQEAEYVLFVRDRKTGAIAYASKTVEAFEREHLIKLPGEGARSRYRVGASLLGH